jgi:GH15 family glucan-1,4-alpha-glucosidase
MNHIGDYALLGDCHSAALVGRDGSVDWACFPRFDSPAVFARILDQEGGGHFRLWAEPVSEVRRAYLDDTNVLVTTSVCEDGEVEVTDCMPIGPGGPAVVRRARCTAGTVDLHLSVAPRFEYGAVVPRFRLASSSSAEVVGGADAMWVTATRLLQTDGGAVTGRWRLAAGDEVWVEAAWTPSHVRRHPPPSAADLAARLAATVAFWRDWMAGCRYQGPHEAAVRRSALVLKALTYAPTGALVAAPTTSLPEEIGGERNWDYRYTWIRDATLTLISLVILGFGEEAAAFKGWLERTGAGRPQDLQIMYGIGGERSLPELTLAHLAGHRGSAPVRVGNGAVKQLQLDCYGQLLEAAYLYGKAGGVISPDNWRFLKGLATIVCQRWESPDQGIWEIRDDPRHFVHSKVNCWLALDRALRIASARGDPLPHAWSRERDQVRSYLLERGAAPGWFPQAVGLETADASSLLVPALGLVPTNHPAAARTIDAVRSSLEVDGLVRRYDAPDGVGGGEGAFLLCSFWLLDCLIHARRLDEADQLLDRLLGLANDVGLYAEQADVVTGEALGNFPQAFTHMALVTSCAHLAAARAGRLPPPGVAHDYAESALDRVLADVAAAEAEPESEAEPIPASDPAAAAAAD